jgi:hypothetical protein
MKNSWKTETKALIEMGAKMIAVDLGQSALDEVENLSAALSVAEEHVTELKAMPRWALSEKPHNLSMAEMTALVKREREKGATDERARIVAWLRAKKYGPDANGYSKHWADEIESGAHLPSATEGE